MVSMSAALLLSLFSGPVATSAGGPDTEGRFAHAARLPDPVRDHLALSAVRAQTEAVVATLGLDAQITSRVKTPHSTWQKMQRKGVGIGEIHDRLAVRVRLDDEASCYRVLSVLHDRYDAVDGELDDYIAHPKPNGYRSLHTALRFPLDGGELAVAEVQIRTHAMHEEAEHGAAAHWRYKLSA